MGRKNRFLDRVLRFMGIEEEEIAAAEHMDVGEGASRASALERASVSVSSGVQNEHTADGRHTNYARVVRLRPLGFDDVQVIADRLLARTPVLMDVEHLDVATARRLLDFLGGTTYAVRGHIQPAGENAFLLTPGGVEVDPNSLPPELSQEFTFRRRL